jgi:glycosyltransferase involved in cell wall biosynthesis
MSPGISFLICTYQAPPSLDLLFDSFQLQKWEPEDEVIVIDNGVEAERLSNVKERLDQLSSRGVRCVYAKEFKTGLTAARLTGFTHIQNDWLVLLDDDNVLGENSLARIRERISLNPQLGGICPRIEPIWEKSPARWVVMLGHEVLSYNTSAVRQIPGSLIVWKGGERGLRPPGGGMIVHRGAVDAFVELSKSSPLLLQLGHRGTALGSGEDFILYHQVYLARRPTAYDSLIVIGHFIPQERMRFGYLCRLLFRANYGFALVALALYGKILFIPSIGHCLIRLAGRLVAAGSAALSLRVMIAFTFAFAGYVCGTFLGLFRSEIQIVKKHKSG